MNIIEKIKSNQRLLNGAWVIATFLIFVGFIGFINGFCIPIGFINVNYELPLGQVGSIDTDKEGNIYLSLERYGYVQKYTKDGHFVKNWKAVSTDGGSFMVQCDGERIYTIPARGNRIVEYDLEGELIGTIDYPVPYPWYKRIEALDSEGNLLILDGWFTQKIAKVDKTTKAKTDLITMDIFRSFIIGPIPKFLFALGVLLLLSLSKVDVFFMS